MTITRRVIPPKNMLSQHCIAQAKRSMAIVISLSFVLTSETIVEGIQSLDARIVSPQFRQSITAFKERGNIQIPTVVILARMWD